MIREQAYRSLSPRADGRVKRGHPRSGAAYLRVPWLFYGPTIALATVVFSVNMLGDALRDTLDPRLRGG